MEFCVSVKFGAEPIFKNLIFSVLLLCMYLIANKFQTPAHYIPQTAAARTLYCTDVKCISRDRASVYHGEPRIHHPPPRFRNAKCFKTIRVVADF